MTCYYFYLGIGPPVKHLLHGKWSFLSHQTLGHGARPQVVESQGLALARARCTNPEPLSKLRTCDRRDGSHDTHLISARHLGRRTRRRSFTEIQVASQCVCKVCPKSVMECACSSCWTERACINGDVIFFPSTCVSSRICHGCNWLQPDISAVAPSLRQIRVVASWLQNQRPR